MLEKTARLNEEKRRKMISTIKGLNAKMRELNKLKKELKNEEKKRKPRTAAVLEEIKVPALELLKGGRAKPQGS